MPRSALSASAETLNAYRAPLRSRAAGKGSIKTHNALDKALNTALNADEIAALSKARAARWKPGLSDQPLHSEIFASSADASGAGLALALARDALLVEASQRETDPLAAVDDQRQVLWVQEARAITRSGRPYLHGLPPEWRDRLIHVEAKNAADALFAIEEGLRCRDFACVIAEIMGNPRALDFTASRRLSLAAQKHGVALWMVRLEARADLSSARMRWRVSPSASRMPHWNADAPGAPTWRAELFRARTHAPGQWTLLDDDTRLRFDEPDKPEAAQPVSRGAAIGSVFAASPRTKPSIRAKTSAAAAYSGHLVRPTVGRSLAACARA